MADVKVLIAPVEPPALRPEQLRDIALRNTNVTGLLGQVDRKRVVVHGPDVLGRKADARAPFSATLFDPLSNRAVGLTGRLGTPDRLETRPVAFAPVPAPDELRRAAAVLRADRRSAPFADRRGVIVYQPMPPLADLERPDGTVARRPTLGIFDPQRRPRHRIVAVDLARRVVDWEPHVHLVPDADCEESLAVGIESLADSGGHPQVRVRVVSGGQEPWNLIVVRPAELEPAGEREGLRRRAPDGAVPRAPRLLAGARPSQRALRRRRHLSRLVESGDAVHRERQRPARAGLARV